MNELDVEQFTKYVVRLIKTLGEVSLTNPDSEETFPKSVVSNVMQSIKITEDNFPIYSRFSVTVEWWADSKYKAMELFQSTNKLLRHYNFAMIGAPIDLYDEITRKHRYGGRYEVNYNGLTNSFERVI